MFNFNEQGLIDLFKGGAQVESDNMRFKNVNMLEIVTGSDLSFQLIHHLLPRRQWYVWRCEEFVFLMGIIPDEWGVSHKRLK